MKKTYGKTTTIGGPLFQAAPVYDPFDSSSASSNSIFTCSTESESTCDPPRDNTYRRRRPKDITNISTIVTGNPQKKRVVRKKPPQPPQQRNQIPDFKEIENYQLTVATVTPIKTHISTSTSTTGDEWNPANFKSPVSWSPVLPSHSSHKQDHERRNGAMDTCSPGGILTRSTTSKLHISQNSRGNISGGSNCSVETRRMKRLRERMSPNVNTSTPDGRRKLTRLSAASASPSMNMSVIPAVEEDELSQQPDHLSCEQPPVETSQRLLWDKPPKLDFDDDPEISTQFSNNSSSIQLLNSMQKDHENASLSLFSTGITEDSNWMTTSSLPGIVEEPESEEEGDHYSVGKSHPNAYRSPEASLSSDKGDSSSPSEHSDASSQTDNSSDYYSSKSCRAPSSLPAHLIQQMQDLQSPTIAERAVRRRQKAIFRECGQNQLLSWPRYLEQRGIDSLVKVGEGVYGEVFLYGENSDTTIIKVVPMEGECTVNDEPQKSYSDMYKEVVITKVLSEIGHNFIHIKRACCIEGPYPEILLDAWDAYHEKKSSENDRPDYFSDDQVYCVFEFHHGGDALESYQFNSCSEALSVLLQVGWSLAVAELRCQFEHRDLHWGNVLIAKSSQETIEYQFEDKPGSEVHYVETHGVKVNIIDFTLSRLDKGKEVVYCDLTTDETLFQGVGDYQFDVYRQMKSCTGDRWRDFHSSTNILWMKYLADKLLCIHTKTRKRAGLTMASFKREIKEFIERCNDYRSSVQMVLTDPLFLSYSKTSEDNSELDDTGLWDE